MTALVDMAGQEINGVKVLHRDGEQGGKPAWLCRCHCGEPFRISGTNLRVKRNPQCPTCAKKHARDATTKHGGVGTREYVSYSAMKQRCYDPNGKRYARYGGRGITVCDRWLSSFAHFLADMGPQPTSKHTIERIDLDGNYEPGNCRWATREEQANNKSNNTRIEINGRTQTITQWSRETGVNRTVILRRMNRGLSGEALIWKAS